jgi:hypothetical protein
MKQINPFSALFAWRRNSDARKLKTTARAPATGDGQNEIQTTMTTKTPSLAAKRAISPATRNIKSPPPPKPQSRQVQTSFAPRLTQPLPAKSLTKAKSVFKNFSLSKFAKGSLPMNYVRESKHPAKVFAVQKKVISRQIEALKESGTRSQGMTLTLPKGTINKLLPSYNKKAGTVDLSDLLNAMAQKMRGTEFYSNGNPTLNRLALQSQVNQIIQSVKEAKK